MKLKDFYPLHFDGSERSFNSFIRSTLIKANYDPILKKITGYKGMHQYNDSKECWTLKFEGKEGIYGLIQSQNSINLDSYQASFDIYYFPSPNEKNLQNSSLIEEYIVNDEQFIEKVKGFSSFLELYLNFKIGKLILNISKKEDSLEVTYKTLSRIKTFAKDGIEDISDLTNNEYIISPTMIDKNFPSFRVLLPFFNFFNTLLTRINKNDPSNFKVIKEKIESINYDNQGIQSKNKDVFSTKLELMLSYNDKEKKKKKLNNLEKVLIKGTWAIYNLDFDLKNQKHMQNNALKPKLIVVTGFLGSGKTNFLQNFIEFENQNSRFVGIIQNEIGKTGLDGKLLDYDYNIEEIDEGCVCCSLAGQLRAAIKKLFEKRVPDTIILETTGVANPFNLLTEIDQLSDLIEFDSIISVIDAKSYHKLNSSYTVFKDQIRAADVILLNKIDLVEKEELEIVESMLHTQNRCASIIKTIRCSINPLEVMNKANLSNSTNEISSEFNEETTVFRTHLEDNLSSIKKELFNKLNRKEFEKSLENIPKNILRVKGIIQFENSTSQFVVQYVNGFYEISELENHKKRENFLIFIGENLQEIKKLIA